MNQLYVEVLCRCLRHDRTERGSERPYAAGAGRRRLRMSGPRLLAVGAHAADAFLAAGGTLAKHSAAGNEITIACLSYGERSHAPGFWQPRSGEHRPVSIEEIRQCKKEEAERAAAILGAEISFLNFGECPLEIDATRMRHLVELVRKLKPSAIVTHWTQDWTNPDHAIAGQALLEACHYAAIPGFETSLNGQGSPPFATGQIYHYAINPICLAPELGLTPDYYVDISSFLDTKTAALKAFTTQDSIERDIQAFAEHVAYTIGYRCHTRYAEAFMTMPHPPRPHQYLWTGESDRDRNPSGSPKEPTHDVS